MRLLEALVRKLAKATTTDGHPSLHTDGDVVLVEAFATLGWTDPYIDPRVPAAEPDEAPVSAVPPAPAATPTHPAKPAKKK
jgi:hypothetical protein